MDKKLVILKYNEKNSKKYNQRIRQIKDKKFKKKDIKGKTHKKRKNNKKNIYQLKLKKITFQVMRKRLIIMK